MVSFQGQPEEYDLLILGSGAGSKLLAWTFGGRGQRVAVVERKYVGGSCPNIACLPSKNVIHTAQFAHNVRRSEEFGISVDGFRVNMSAVRDRKRKMVQGLVDTHLALYKQTGAELIMASGRFVGPKTILRYEQSVRRVVRSQSKWIDATMAVLIRQASPKIGFEARGRLVAFLCIFGEESHDDRGQGLGNAAAIHRRDRLTRDVAVDPFQRIGGGEW
jgi:hypothetical protein